MHLTRLDAIDKFPNLLNLVPVSAQPHNHDALISPVLSIDPEFSLHACVNNDGALRFILEHALGYHTELVKHGEYVARVSRERCPIQDQPVETAGVDMVGKVVRERFEDLGHRKAGITIDEGLDGAKAR